MLNIAVVGHGFLGKWHAEKVFKNTSVNLCAIVEANEAAHSEISSKYEQTPIVSSINDLNLDKVDGVIISTPTSTHFDLTKFFLEKNKHVFCEKPLCSTLEQAKELEKFLTTDIILQVGHSERYHPIWTQFKKDLAQTKGPYLIKADRCAPFKGRATDVDVVQDLMIHDLDLVNFLFSNLQIKNQKSFGFMQRTEHSDHAQTDIDFSDGSNAVITVSRNYVFEKRSFEVVCKQGAFYVDLFTAEYFKALGQESDPEKFVVKETYQKADHLDLEQKAFFAAINKQAENPVDYKQGLEAVRLVENVREQIK